MSSLTSSRRLDGGLPSVSSFKIRQEDFKLDFDDDPLTSNPIMTPKKLLIQGFKGCDENENDETLDTSYMMMRQHSHNQLTKKIKSDRSTPSSPLSNISNINQNSPSSISICSDNADGPIAFAMPSEPTNRRKRSEMLLKSLSSIQSPKTNPACPSPAKPSLAGTTNNTITTPVKRPISSTSSMSVATPSKLKTPLKTLSSFASPIPKKRTSICPPNSPPTFKSIEIISSPEMSYATSTSLTSSPSAAMDALSLSSPFSSPLASHTDTLSPLSPPSPMSSPPTGRSTQQRAVFSGLSKKSGQFPNKRIQDIKHVETDLMKSIKTEVHPSSLEKCDTQQLDKVKDKANKTTSTSRSTSGLKTSTTPVHNTAAKPTSVATSKPIPMSLTTKPTPTNATVTSKKREASETGIKTAAQATTPTPTPTKKIRQDTNPTHTTPLVNTKRLPATTPTSTSRPSLSNRTATTTTPTPLSTSKPRREVTLSSSKKSAPRLSTMPKDDDDFEARIESALLAAAQGNVLQGSLLMTSPEKEQQEQSRSQWSPINKRR
ncbi:hypothetical protein SAMD00019534_073190 [Acytostelium subglobosum LB1]|uniref:hypothetical protein n=1 Tax=Acytostelium subglobosum LB1 TaxID=1410327 RepID=UPI000644DB15|nr:hypothetical protein SAMD00019534_073190 [Acytostelium subglobosum LB1]GAM24144.1 hypothetical protein SAMD00019534_073190 [Acytostelium subglobosum LB1]|eukprot:XP_012753180.1 hypothetical protein SAMD00019534_073190 [Acytostelium subglobosum LB1]